MLFQRTLLRNEQEETMIKEEKVDSKDNAASEEHSAASSTKMSPAPEISPTKRLSKKRKSDLLDLPMEDQLSKVGCSSLNNPP